MGMLWTRFSSVSSTYFTNVPEKNTAQRPAFVQESQSGGVHEEHGDGVIEQSEHIDRVQSPRQTNENQYIWRHLQIEHAWLVSHWSSSSEQ